MPRFETEMMLGRPIDAYSNFVLPTCLEHLTRINKGAMKSAPSTKFYVAPIPQPTELVAKLTAPTRKPNTLMPSRNVATFNPNIIVPANSKGPPTLKYTANFAQLISENEVDDEEDDADLVKILEKLKDAKKTLDTTKQRKREREELESKYNYFIKETRSTIGKHNRKWNEKIDSALENAKQARFEYAEVHQKLHDEINAFEQQLFQLENSIETALEYIEEFELAVKIDDEKFSEDTQGNFEQIRKETQGFMEDVKRHMIDIYNQSNKDDKLTRLIKTFLANI